MPDSLKPLISVVVIGRNEGQRLETCLHSVHAADTEGMCLELIYVDSDSSDGSAERAQACGARVLRVKPIRPSAALGRNAGWRAANGQYVLFLDGDTVLDHSFLRRAINEINMSPEIAVVWGHRREIAPEVSVYNRVLDLDWIYAPGDTDFCGGDALFKREALERTGGFDDTLIAGEEPELCVRLRAMGYRIRHIDAPMTGHDLAITHWRQYWRRAERAGHAYSEISARFANTSSPLWLRESRRNYWHAGIMMSALLTTMLCVLAGVPELAVVAVSAASAIVLRTALRARWKHAGPFTLLAYAIHSHLQQLPILWGQLAWQLARRRGQARRLIEYKGPQT
ncbi:MAG: glycosyltransferase family A protein [Pseudohongiella sp.]|nr:glycosyltransferase family A protein [Pseudohongiella sp.]